MKVMVFQKALLFQVFATKPWGISTSHLSDVIQNYRFDHHSTELESKNYETPYVIFSIPHFTIRPRSKYSLEHPSQTSLLFVRTTKENTSILYYEMQDNTTKLKWGEKQNDCTVM